MKMTNQQYGKRVRERQEFTRSVMRNIRGKDKAAHRMAIKRKAGPGIGNFADITKPMSASRLGFIRDRLRRATHESLQREWIGFNPFHAIRKKLLA